jgi:hypothetical protein
MRHNNQEIIMSIEDKIDGLTKAFTDLTKAIINLTGVVESSMTEETIDDAPVQQVSKSTPVKTAAPTLAPKVVAKPVPVVAAEEDDFLGEDEVEQATVASVKDLAKSKMAAGVDRAKIKELITGLGGESVSDLSDTALNKLTAELNKL